MRKLAIALIFLVVLVSGCTTQQATSTTTEEGVKQFNVVIGHTYYAPSIFSVNLGDTVRLRAIAEPGTSSHMHGMTIDEFNVNQAVTSEDPDNPVIIEFVADQSGEFTIYCKTCFTGPFGLNHPNIQGTLIVRG